MTRYAIVDVSNLFHRARHVVRDNAFVKASAAIHIMFKSLRKLHREMGTTHVVLATDARSWRHDVYPFYKAKRIADRENQTPAEQEENEIMQHAMKEFIDFMAERTRCTVLHSPGVEGDDWVARWIQLHAQDEHVILSSDSDFVQLLAPNVSIYDGVNERILTTDGVFNARGDALAFHIDSGSGKIKVGDTIPNEKKKHDAAEKDKANKAAKEGKKPYLPKPFEFHVEPEWWRKALFVKIIRGDKGDGVFSAYPGVRYNGSANKLGICEAWEDRTGKGFNWNNFMLTRWEKLDESNPEKTESVRVLDEFHRNEMLIDLTKQPEHIKALMDEVIIQAVQKEAVRDVGFAFMQFCGAHDLPNLAQEASQHTSYLAAAYGA